MILLGTTGSLVVSDITFTGDSIRITTDGIAGAGLHSATFQIVPEPGAALLVLFATVGLGDALRRARALA